MPNHANQSKVPRLSPCQPADTMAAYKAGKLKDLLAGVGYSI